MATEAPMRSPFLTGNFAPVRRELDAARDAVRRGLAVLLHVKTNDRRTTVKIVRGTFLKVKLDKIMELLDELEARERPMLRDAAVGMV